MNLAPFFSFVPKKGMRSEVMNYRIENHNVFFVPLSLRGYKLFKLISFMWLIIFIHFDLNHFSFPGAKYHYPS